jgi:hypothetical protein
VAGLLQLHEHHHLGWFQPTAQHAAALFALLALRAAKAAEKAAQEAAKAARLEVSHIDRVCREILHPHGPMGAASPQCEMGPNSTQLEDCNRLS